MKNLWFNYPKGIKKGLVLVKKHKIEDKKFKKIVKMVNKKI